MEIFESKSSSAAIFHKGQNFCVRRLTSYSFKSFVLYSTGVAAEIPRVSQLQVHDIHIYLEPPKPTFLEVLMINNLVLRWPKALLSMVLGAHGRWFHQVSYSLPHPSDTGGHCPWKFPLLDDRDRGGP